jgi:quercetin dioxygenase-like cupin family protein
MKIVKKPWGEEIWIAYDNGRYAGKILKIKKGHRLSLQYHKKKHETLYLHKGKLYFTLEDEKGNLKKWLMKKNETVVVEPGKKHRMEANSDVEIFEFSSPELDDVVRIEDDYGRKD